jgi:acyl-CoA reductase-like NAD-dependent aldehyde dehydrogenase
LNASPFQFAHALFTFDESIISRAQQELGCMNLVINDHTAWRVDEMPFGGHRQSGLGMGGVRFAVEEQSRLMQLVRT